MNQARWLVATFVILAALSFIWGHNPDQVRLKDTVYGPVIAVVIPNDCTLKGVGCDLSLGQIGNVLVRAPKEIKPLKKFSLVVEPQGDASKSMGAVSVDFQMVGMDMGINRYPLTRSSDGNYAQNIILPVCTTTRTDWVADLSFTTTAGTFVAKIPFIVDHR
ncbi:hypothetical protein [Halothiobacillus sp.]|uniref:hypothetical protein n=1 Tax=Halothiobacillus sp. TaxID=1891311 RepID=UPI0026052F91|nr:hypothetical protein [Halothiobacillus sp.]